ncbi:TPA: hypothetical protein ACR6ZM_005373, partial [Klebsiella pneumoniae]
YLLTSSVFFVSSVAFHYILTMPFIRVWYVISMVYFRDAGISHLMEKMKDGIEICYFLNLPASCLYVAYKTWIDYRSDTITLP